MVDVVVGRVGRPHGVRGDVTVHALTDEPARRFVAGVSFRCSVRGQASDRVVRLASVRRHGDKLLVTFEGVDSRDAAAELTGTLLSVDVPEDEETGESDTWYDHQLVGLSVRSMDGRELGTVRRLEHGGAQDLLVVVINGQERLVPFVSAIVPTVDPAGGFVVVDPPGGLLDDADV